MKFKLLIVTALLAMGLPTVASEVNEFDESLVQGSIEEELDAELSEEQSTEMSFQGANPFKMRKILGSPFNTSAGDQLGRDIGSCRCSGGYDYCMKVRGHNFRGWESSRVCRKGRLKQTVCTTKRQLAPNGRYTLAYWCAYYFTRISPL